MTLIHLQPVVCVLLRLHDTCVLRPSQSQSVKPLILRGSTAESLTLTLVQCTILPSESILFHAVPCDFKSCFISKLLPSAQAQEKCMYEDLKWPLFKYSIYPLNSFYLAAARLARYSRGDCCCHFF